MNCKCGEPAMPDNDKCMACIGKEDNVEKEINALALRDLDGVKTDLTAIKAFQDLIRSQMVVKVDFGVIPGTQKPTLLKPGAEKMLKLLMCSDAYEIMSETEDWDKEFFSYKVRCRACDMRSGKLVSEGIGECNSKESKYRWRWLFQNQLPADVDPKSLVSRTLKSKKDGKPYTQYRMDNDDICSQVNTILKMAKKRALVDAALSAGRLSQLFTQDIEDMERTEAPANGAGETRSAQTPAKPKPVPSGDDWRDLLGWGYKGYGYISQAQMDKIIHHTAKTIGRERFMTILGDFGCEQPNEVKYESVQTFIDVLKAEVKAQKEG